MSSPTPRCLSSYILPLTNSVQHLPPLLSVAQGRGQLSIAHVYLYYFMSATTLCLPAVSMLSTSVRFTLWRGLSHPIRLNGFLVGFFRSVLQASHSELTSLSLCKCREVVLNTTSRDTTVRCFSNAGLLAVSVSIYHCTACGKVARF